MQSVSFCLGEVSQHVFDAVQAAAKNVPNVGVNIVNMEIRNMGVVTNSAHKFTDAEFEQIMRIFMSEQPDSTGYITVNFAWHLTAESQRKLYQLMDEATVRAEQKGANMHHSVEIVSDNTIALRSFPMNK